MALLLLMPGRDTSDLAEALRARDSGIDVRVWPELGDPADVEMVVAWHHPPGSLAKFPYLRAAVAYGAGADALCRDPDLPAEAYIGRLIGPSLVRQMVEYLLAVVLSHKRHLPQYWAQHRAGRWAPIATAERHAVGVLGLGELGAAIARRFAELEFEVHGWARSQKTVAGAVAHAGPEGLDTLLPCVDYLICALPLTPETHGILDRQLFRRLKTGAFVINVGRGEHLVEDDLLAALDERHLSGACLDVFRQEPLPSEHPFWGHPKILVTPHIASITDPAEAAEQILASYANLRAGQAPLHTVSRELGY